jgi:hypothetical protein
MDTEVEGRMRWNEMRLQGRSMGTKTASPGAECRPTELQGRSGGISNSRGGVKAVSNRQGSRGGASMQSAVAPRAELAGKKKLTGSRKRHERR